MSKARRVILAAGVLMLALVSSGLTAPASSAATWTTPAFVRSVGTRGEANIYAFGMAYNPVTNEMIVGDYWNYEVRRYDMNGNLLSSFYLPPNQRHGQPYAIMTDPRNGDIYVTEWAENLPSGWTSHWSPTGVFIGAYQIPGIVYDAWGTIDPNGHMYVSDSHPQLNNQFRPPQVKEFDLNNNYAPITQWGTWGTAPGQIELIHGIDYDSAGNIYVAEADNLTIDVYSSSGTFLYNFGQQGPANVVGDFTGDLRGLAIDRVHGWVYVVDAEAGQIEKFALNGTPLAHWGSIGFGAGQFADGGRGVTVDNNGNVWVADFGNYRFMEYDSNGNLLHTYPNLATGPALGGFNQVRDVAVDASGNMWTVDTQNHRVEEFAPNGTFLQTWGFRNSLPPYGMDYPRGIGIDPATGNIWVVNTRDMNIRVYKPDGTYVATYGSGIQGDDPGEFSWPMDVEFYGGDAYVSSYHSRFVKVLDAATGTELYTIPGPTSFGLNNGVAVDPATGNVYVLDYNFDRVTVYAPGPGGAVLFSWGSTGTGDGQFGNPWDIDIANGVVYITDPQLSRVQAFSLSGTFLGKWGTSGSGPTQFNAPSGITHDAAGNLYIADALDDRIVEYNPAATPPVGDTTRPTIAITSPTSNQVLPDGEPIIQGTATDNVGVGTAEVAIQNISSGLWWNASFATWQTAKNFNLAGMIGSSPMTSATWRFPFVGVLHGGQYHLEVRTTDTSGNRNQTDPTRNFSVGTQTVVDTTAPVTTFTKPTLDQSLPTGAVAIGGNVTDDISGVATVQIAIQNRVTKQWWNVNTNSFSAGLKWFSATVASPGALATTWSYTWNGDVSGGSYYVQARGTDETGNVKASPFPFTRFKTT